MRFASKTARAALAQIVALSGLLMGGPAAADPQADAWSEIPDTHMRDVQPTQAEVDAIAPGLWSAIKGHTWAGRLSMWTGMSFDPVERQLCFPFAGGHADYGGSDIQCIDLDDASPHWATVFPILPLDGPVQGDCNGPTFGSPARHTYDGFAYLGDHLLLGSGARGYCKSGVGTKGAYYIDTSTDPWTFTEKPDMLPYVGAFSGVHGDHVILATGTKIAQFDKATGTLILSRNRTSGFGSAAGAMGIDQSGLACAADGSSLKCIDITGTIAGSWVSRASGSAADPGSCMSKIGGYSSMTPVGDGHWFAIWRGDTAVVFFNPGDGNVPANDQCIAFEPETGPTDGTSGRVYEKLHWDAATCSLVGYSNIDEGVWTLPVSGVGCVINEAPEAQDDAFNGAEDTQLAGNVLANDSDEDALTATALTLPAVGVLALQTNGTFTFDPPADFFGVVTFDYTVCDPHAECDTATVTLTVIEVDDPAIVQDEAYEVLEEGTVNGNVAANDSDSDSILDYVFGSAPNGFSGGADGSFSYTGPLDFFGVVTVSYTANGIPGTLTITVTDVPDFAADEGDYGPNPQASLASLCARPDTLLCDPLDNTPISGPAIDENTPYLTLDQVVDATHYGKWRWANVKTNGCGTSPRVDNTVGVEGGSIQFIICSQSGAGGGGDYDVNVTPDYYANNPELRVVQGDDIVARYRIRFSCDLLFADCDPQSPTYKQAYRDYLGSGGFKIGAIGEAAFPGEVIDGGEGVASVVCSNYKERGFLGCYVSQWNANVSTKVGTVNGISVFDLQPGPDGQPYCLSHDASGAQYNPADPNCFMLDSDQWYTVQLRVHFGQTLQFQDNSVFHSHFRLWIAPEGQPFTLVVDKPINLKRSNLQGDVLPTLGRIGISSFMTGKDNSEVHPDAYIWYDNLWVAKP